MSVSMYQASVPALIRGLNNLSAILDKAAADAAARNIAPDVLLNARLAPDMFALTRQVQIASDSAKGCAARLAGVDVPSYADDEASFADLQQRIAKTVAFLQGFNAAQIDGSETREVVLKVRGDEIRFSGQNYLLGFVLPNFYFHLTAAYAILRHNGVALGKMDYLGGV
ncbi:MULTISPECIES: DUF1993 family protein [Chromobacterium]|uniref:DUF1993 domain-containing protein n=1 Tax=Chromobacterium TaxID=535 RepID=UPI0009D922BF|nr:MULTISPECIES: DUF1993 domain-containing protein [Chromobacterium]MCP1293042.1 DUF1993 domain-containing protein [Chromobacterium sp. S0633]OQS36448.1 hypothetical protein B0T39_16605 [Chromobacterium haemolyticum]PTU66838.1 DUF1993 domain-containing protein [Chromobacterium sp. Panama]UJB32233.1 DUF1993 domain-containing protein [Chromobacterium sp. Beijing]